MALPTQYLLKFCLKLAHILTVYRNRHLIMCQLQLKHHALLRSEKIFASQQIEIPHADKSLIIDLTDFADVRMKIGPPMPQGLGVMPAHDFQIDDLQPLMFGCQDHLIE